jgi:hypothetical protein
LLLYSIFISQIKREFSILGIPAEKFIRVGGSPKISDRIKSRSLRELGDSRFTQEETRMFAGLKMMEEALQKEIAQRRKDTQLTVWSKSISSCWKEVQEFLGDHHEHFELLSEVREERASIANVMYCVCAAKRDVTVVVTVMHVVAAVLNTGGVGSADECAW